MYSREYTILDGAGTYVVNCTAFPMPVLFIHFRDGVDALVLRCRPDPDDPLVAESETSTTRPARTVTTICKFSAGVAFFKSFPPPHPSTHHLFIHSSTCMPRIRHFHDVWGRRPLALGREPRRGHGQSIKDRSEVVCLSNDERRWQRYKCGWRTVKFTEVATYIVHTRTPISVHTDS